ncbi:MAG: hypothetical protein ACRCUT_12855, partial [Spirochaetota bacterium]
MVERTVRKIAPEGFNFRETWWYNNIEKKTDEYRRRILSFSLIAAALFPVFFAVSDLCEGQYDTMTAYFSSCAVISCLGFIYLKSREKRIIIHLVLSGFCASLVMTVWLPPAANALYIVLFFGFPLIAHQLRGSKEGSAWAAVFLLICAVIVVSHLTGFSALSFSYTPRQYITSLAAYCLIFALSFIIQRQQEAYITY